LDGGFCLEERQYAQVRQVQIDHHIGRISGKAAPADLVDHRVERR
tara:strand:- start:31 stop:165 length:135 start_codon:yes stop_codon:yes gene_type:complete